MNEKTKNKLIIIFACTTLIASGFAVYYGRSGTTGTGQQALDTITEQRTTIQQLQSDLDAATESIKSAESRAEELGQRYELAQQLARQSAQWITELGTTVAESGNSIQELINRQRRINELIKRIEANNNAITE